jgi:hypothetical protein
VESAGRQRSMAVGDSLHWEDMREEVWWRDDGSLDAFYTPEGG